MYLNTLCRDYNLETIISLASKNYNSQNKILEFMFGYYSSCFPPSVYFETYGCQMNVSDTEVAWSILKDAGYSRTTVMSEVYYGIIFITTTCICYFVHVSVTVRVHVSVTVGGCDTSCYLFH